MITTPFAFNGNPDTVAVQPFASVNVATTSFPPCWAATPLAFNWTEILVGLLPSWFDTSSHTFLTVALTTAGVCLFVIVISPVVSSVFLLIAYVSGPSIPVNTVVFFSSTVYVANCPFLYLGNCLNVASQAGSSPVWSVSPFNSISLSSISEVPSLNWNVTDLGLIPSWLFASSQTFLALTSTVISVVSLSLVTVNPELSPVTVVV